MVFFSYYFLFFFSFPNHFLHPCPTALVHVLNDFLVSADGGTGWTGIGATDRSKLWNSVLSLYKHENVHLAEAASVLTRLIQKEYPR